MAVAAVGLVAGGASASSSGAAAASGGATIKMKLKDKRTFFTGDKTVKKGAKLEIVNTSDPKNIGPHTFTLVAKEKVPITKADRKACGKNQLEVCVSVAKAHKFNPQTEKVEKPTVDVAKKGWDKSFGKRGDTWYTEAKGDSQSRKVTAAVGTTLYYFCVVHPEMHGEIKVVK